MRECSHIKASLVVLIDSEYIHSTRLALFCNQVLARKRDFVRDGIDNLLIWTAVVIPLETIIEYVIFGVQFVRHVSHSSRVRCFILCHFQNLFFLRDVYFPRSAPNFLSLCRGLQRHRFHQMRQVLLLLLFVW